MRTAEAQAPLPNGECQLPGDVRDWRRRGPVPPSETWASQGSYYNNYFTTVNSVDWNISNKDQFRVRFSYEKWNGTDIFGQIPAFWTIVPQRFEIITGSEYHTFSPNLSNEVRFGFNRNTNDYPSSNSSFPGLDAYPNLAIGIIESAGVQLGADPNAPQFGVQNFYQLVDNISWLKGRHNFKFGRGVSRVHLAAGVYAAGTRRL